MKVSWPTLVLWPVVDVGLDHSHHMIFLQILKAQYHFSLEPTLSSWEYLHVDLHLVALGDPSNRPSHGASITPGRGQMNPAPMAGATLQVFAKK